MKYVRRHTLVAGMIIGALLAEMHQRNGNPGGK